MERTNNIFNSYTYNNEKLYQKRAFTFSGSGLRISYACSLSRSKNLQDKIK
nr:MAG TPA: hypothetical protein [Bacteriophage sp.]